MPNSSEHFDKKPHTITPDQLKKLLDLAYELKVAIEANDMIKVKEIKKQGYMLVILLDYLTHNLTNPNLDRVILEFLRKFFTKNTKKELQEEKKIEVEEEKLSKQEREHRHRMMVYEIYKVVSPRRLAGETAIDNFIHNVITRGIKAAINYEGDQFAKFFDKKELENLESYRESFVNVLKEQGVKGGGKGMK